MSYATGIADAIARMGDAQSRGALQKGQIYGNLAHDLGQAPLNYLAIQRGLRTNQHQDIVQGEQERKIKAQQQLEQLLASTPPGPQKWSVTRDWAATNDPAMAMEMDKVAYEAATHQYKAQSGTPGTQPIMSPDPVTGEPTQMDNAMGHAPVQFPSIAGQAPFSMTPQTDVQMQTKANEQLSIVERIKALAKREGQLPLDQRAKEAEALAAAKKKGEVSETPPPPAKQDTSISPYEDFRSADPAARARAEAYLNKTRPPSSASASVPLTRDALDAEARYYIKTHALSAFGMGAQGGVRQQIMNRAAEIAKEEGNVDYAGNQAGFKANQTSLSALQKNRDAVVAFENTALKNLLQFQQTAKPLIDSGSPLINIPLRQAAKKLMGQPEVAAFDAARRVAVNEFAKVLTNPNLAGQLSDSARHEVESLIPEEATLKQIYAVAEILKTDAANRHQSLDEQLAEIKGRIGGNKGGESPSRRSGDPIKIISIKRVN